MRSAFDKVPKYHGGKHQAHSRAHKVIEFLLVLAVLVAASSYISHNWPPARRFGLVMLDWGFENRNEHRALQTTLVKLARSDRGPELPSQMLRPEVLLKIVRRIDSLKPAAIGVDIFTHDPAYESTSVDDVGTPIVWAFGHEGQTGDFLPPLGGRALPPTYSGYAGFLSGEDKVLREYRRFLARGSAEPIETFPHAIVRAACVGRRVDCERVEVPRVLRDSIEPLYYLNRRSSDVATIQVHDLMTADPSRLAALGSLVQHRIVILGDSGLGDVHQTAGGEELGMVAVAQMVESELAPHQLVAELPFWKTLAIEILLGILVGLMFETRWPVASGIGIALAIGILFVIPRFSILYQPYWVDVIPLIIGFALKWAVEGALQTKRELARRGG